MEHDAETPQRTSDDLPGVYHLRVVRCGGNVKEKQFFLQVREFCDDIIFRFKLPSYDKVVFM